MHYGLIGSEEQFIFSKTNAVFGFPGSIRIRIWILIGALAGKLKRWRLIYSANDTEWRECEGGASEKIKCLLAGVQINSPQCICTLSLLANQGTQMCTSFSEHGITRSDKQDLVTGSTADGMVWFLSRQPHFRAEEHIEGTHICNISAWEDFLKGRFYMRRNFSCIQHIKNSFFMRCVEQNL